MSDNVKIMERELKKIQKNFLKQIDNYKNFIRQSEQDAPIEVLCLPKDILGILRREGINRVYELTSRDFTKIKGFGSVRLGLLQAALDKFVLI